MASRVVGLDIGASSVKAVTLDVSLRGFQLVEAQEEPILPATDGPGGAEASPPADSADSDSPAPRESRSGDEGDPTNPRAEIPSEPGLSPGVLDALRRLRARGGLTGDIVVTAMSESRYYLATLDLPFGTTREIEAVLRPQLDGRVPESVDSLALDFQVGGRAPSGEFRVFAAALPPERVGAWLAALAEVGLDPRVADLAPFPLMTAARFLEPAETDPVGVVDIGAETTSIVVFRGGELQYARSFAGGGELATRALAEAFGLDEARAREGKHREGFIDSAAPESGGPTGNDSLDVANACREAAKPLVRELRRCLHAHLTSCATPVSRLILCGGAMALPGLPEYLSHSLGVPVTKFQFSKSEVAGLAGFPEVGHRFVSALGLALRASSGATGSSFNLRRGAFAFRGHYEFIQARIGQIAAGAIGLIAATGLFLLGHVASLRAEQKALSGALGEATEEIFGQPLLVPARIITRLNEPAGDASFMPRVSAFDMFARLTEVVQDVNDEGYTVQALEIEVDMMRHTFEMRGTADSAESVDKLDTVLEQTLCVVNVQRDELSQARGQDGFEYGFQGGIECASAPAVGEGDRAEAEGETPEVAP